MNTKKEIKIVENAIKNGTFLSTKRNNYLLNEFLKAKENGFYGRIVYKTRINSDRTKVKKARNIFKIDKYFNKDFDKLTQDDIIKLRNDLNNDKIFKDKTMIKWKRDKEGKPTKSYIEVIPTKEPVGWRIKSDYKSNFCELMAFMQEVIYQETNKEVADITKYFVLQRPEDFRSIKVEFMEDDELHKFLINIKNRKFKAVVQLSIMSGARPCEILKVRYGKGYNLYKNKQGKWIIHLPKIKRISYAKFPFEVDMYEDELYPYFDNLNLKSGDLVFKMNDTTFRKLMRHYSEKYLNKRYSPKILRKTARMLRTNAGYSHDWINKLMGHEPGSKVQGHYTNYEGIKNDDQANERMKGQQYPSLKRDYENIKQQLKAQQEQMNVILAQFDDIEELKKAITIKKKEMKT